MPGDPGGVSLLFPPRGRPAPPLPRSGALYRARALGRLSSSSPRAAVGSARGGAGRAPRGAEERSSFTLLSPHSALPGTLKPVQAAAPAASFLAPQQTFGPSPAPRPLFVVAQARPRRPEGSSGPPSLQLRPLQDPETCRPHFCPPSTISTSCARYAEKQGGRRTGKQEALRVFRLGLLSSASGVLFPP